MNNIAVKVPVTIVAPRRRRKHRHETLDGYVPSRLRKYLDHSSHDEDGYWFYFDPKRVKGGACDTGIIHTDTLAEAKAEMSDMIVIG